MARFKYKLSILQIIPLEPQIAQELRAGQVIQVPVAALARPRTGKEGEGSTVQADPLDTSPMYHVSTWTKTNHR